MPNALTPAQAMTQEKTMKTEMKDREEGKKYLNAFIEAINADHLDVIPVGRDQGCLMRDEIEHLRREAGDSPEWFDWDIDKETHEQYRDRLLNCMPALSQSHIDCLQQLRMTVWDGNLMSKGHRDDLVRQGFVDRWNGWQVISRKGMALLDVLGFMNDDRWPKKAGKQ